MPRTQVKREAACLWMSRCLVGTYLPPVLPRPKGGLFLYDPALVPYIPYPTEVHDGGHHHGDTRGRSTDRCECLLRNRRTRHAGYRRRTVLWLGRPCLASP